MFSDRSIPCYVVRYARAPPDSCDLILCRRPHQQCPLLRSLLQCIVKSISGDRSYLPLSPSPSPSLHFHVPSVFHKSSLRKSLPCRAPSPNCLSKVPFPMLSQNFKNSQSSFSDAKPGFKLPNSPPPPSLHAVTSAPIVACDRTAALLEVARLPFLLSSQRRLRLSS